MNINEKIDLIIKNKDPACAALESVTDRIYDLTDDLLNDKGRIMTAKIGNYQAEEFVKDLREDAEKYEAIKTKLESNNFDLSLIEINKIALAFYFCVCNLDDNIKALTKAKDLSENLLQSLMSPEDLAKNIDNRVNIEPLTDKSD